MKNILSSLLLFCGLSMIVLSACKKDQAQATAIGGATDTLTASANTLTLTRAQAGDTVVTFNWSATNFGYSAAITYLLQFDVQGNNFSNAKEVAIPVGSFSKSYTGVDFNALLLSMGLTPGADTTIEARIASSISTAYTTAYSNPVPLRVNPYPLVSYVYVPGEYQVTKWDPTTADSLKSATSNNIYTGVINFTPGNLNFKITPQKNWNVAYGSAGDSTISTTAGGNISAPAAGSYLLTVNLNANTITFTPTVWSIIGDATPGGWSTDTDMQFNNGTQTWSVVAPLTANNLKFRLNHNWDVNYGVTGGVFKPGGDNIPITQAGTYLITLDLNTSTYSLVKQ